MGKSKGWNAMNVVCRLWWRSRGSRMQVTPQFSLSAPRHAFWANFAVCFRTTTMQLMLSQPLPICDDVSGARQWSHSSWQTSRGSLPCIR